MCLKRSKPYVEKSGPSLKLKPEGRPMGLGPKNTWGHIGKICMWREFFEILKCNFRSNDARILKNGYSKPFFNELF